MSAANRRKWSRVPELVSLGDFSQFFEGRLKRDVSERIKPEGKGETLATMAHLKKPAAPNQLPGYTTSF